MTRHDISCKLSGVGKGLANLLNVDRNMREVRLTVIAINRSRLDLPGWMNISVTADMGRILGVVTNKRHMRISTNVSAIEIANISKGNSQSGSRCGVNKGFLLNGSQLLHVIRDMTFAVVVTLIKR